MEQLTKSVEQISLDSTKSDVGVFFHKDMLLHRSPNPHPENPDRLSSILNHLEAQNLFSQCKVYDDFGEISLDILSDFHGEDYVDYITSMWDENSKKEVRFYKDTYYNQHSARVGSLAANAIKLAVDEVLTGKLARAFGIVRPPGHHAAASHNRIGGFCIYNSVAVAAKYAIKNYGLKRVLIFDWDVHHGDGSAHFLSNDASILYISVHRYDKGAFYPGESGDMKKVGEGEAKGYNLNYPWDLPHPYYTVGDDEYIYGLERVFMPIIDEFDPELIFISAGFDAACGDPLGGLDVSPDGYAYMTKRLMDKLPSKIIIGLEGGYNLNSISKSSEACLRILLGEQMPLKCSHNQLTYEEMKEKCCPNKVGLETAKQALETFKDYWPIIETKKEAIEFQEKSEENVKNNNDRNFEDKSYIIKYDKFLKQADKETEEFYENICGKSFSHSILEDNKLLLPFLPNYQGIAKIGTQAYLIFENLLFQRPTASILQIDFNQGDFKVSKLIVKDNRGQIKAQKSESDTLGSGKSELLSEFFQNQTNHNEILTYFKEFIVDLKKLAENNPGKSWKKPSIMFILDSQTNYHLAKLTSVEGIQQGTDENYKQFISGLENLSTLFTNTF